MLGHPRLPCSPCGAQPGPGRRLWRYRHPTVFPACVAARGRRQVSYLCAAARSLRARRRCPLRPPSRPVGTCASAPTVSATDRRPASAPASRRGCPVKTQPHIGPRYNSVYFKSPLPRPQLNPVLYKGFTITARTFQVHGSGRWTLDLLIGRNTDLRAFSGPSTYPTEESAITGCCEFGQRIIDGRVRNCSVDDLS